VDLFSTLAGSRSQNATPMQCNGCWFRCAFLRFPAGVVGGLFGWLAMDVKAGSQGNLGKQGGAVDRELAVGRLGSKVVC
jgi:hypothetical protein